VLAAWESLNLPLLAKALGATDPPAWPGHDYDSVFVLRFQQRRLTSFHVTAQNLSATLTPGTASLDTTPSPDTLSPDTTPGGETGPETTPEPETTQGPEVITPVGATTPEPGALEGEASSSGDLGCSLM